MENFNKKDIYLLIILYILCHGSYIFLGNFLFFDDVWLFNSSSDVRNYIFKTHGYEFTSSFHDVLILLPPIIIRSIVFLIIMLQAFLIYKILINYNIKCANTIFITLALFLLSPYNISRINAINFPAQIYIVFFLLAFLYQDRYFGLSLLFYFISFYYHSLLFLFCVPFFVYVNEIRIKDLSPPKFYLRLIIFAILPFLFWFYKLHYHSPSEEASLYNKIFFDGEILSNFIIMIKNFISLSINFCFLIITFLILCLTMPNKFHNYKYHNLSFINSCFLFVISVLPYLLVKKLPWFYDWDTRHQILLIFPSIYLLLFLFRIFKSNHNYYFLNLILSFCICFNLSNYFGYYIEVQKHNSFSSFILDNKENINNFDVVVVKDNTNKPLHRHIRITEYSYMLNKHFVEKNKLCLSLFDYRRFLQGAFDKDFGIYLPSFNRNKNLKICWIKNNGGISLTQLLNNKPILQYSFYSP